MPQTIEEKLLDAVFKGPESAAEFMASLPKELKFTNDPETNLAASLEFAARYGDEDEVEKPNKIFQAIIARTSIETLQEMGILTGLANNRHYSAVQFILDKGYDINTRVKGGKDLFSAVAEQMREAADQEFLIELISTKKIFGLEGAVADLVIFGIQNGMITPKGTDPVDPKTRVRPDAMTIAAGEVVEPEKLPEELRAVELALQAQSEKYFTDVMPSYPLVTSPDIGGGRGGGGGGRYALLVSPTSGRRVASGETIDVRMSPAANVRSVRVSPDARGVVAVGGGKKSDCCIVS
jgi:hypothetical protein